MTKTPGSVHTPQQLEGCPLCPESLELSLLKRAEWSMDARRQEGEEGFGGSGQKEAEAAVVGLVLMRMRMQDREMVSGKGRSESMSVEVAPG